MRRAGSAAKSRILAASKGFIDSASSLCNEPGSSWVFTMDGGEPAVLALLLGRRNEPLLHERAGDGLVGQTLVEFHHAHVGLADKKHDLPDAAILEPCLTRGYDGRANAALLVIG